MNASDDQPWLLAYLEQAVAQEFCPGPICTTCGAMAFRSGLLDAYASALRVPRPRRLDRAAATSIARALAAVRVDDTQARRLEPWARCLIFDLHREALGAPAELEALLGSRWAGDLLGRMRAHAMERLRNQRLNAEFTSPEAINARREAKRQARQQRHAERLATKKERDCLWHANHPREE